MQQNESEMVIPPGCLYRRCRGVDGERHGDRSPASLLWGDSGMIFSSDTDSSTARQRERRGTRITWMMMVTVIVMLVIVLRVCVNENMYIAFGLQYSLRLSQSPCTQWWRNWELNPDSYLDPSQNAITCYNWAWVTLNPLYKWITNYRKNGI